MPSVSGANAGLIPVLSGFEFQFRPIRLVLSRRAIQALSIFLHACLLFTGCRNSPGGSGLVTTGRGPNGKSISINSFQGKLSNAWTQDAENRLYTSSRNITFAGKCTSVGTLQVVLQSGETLGEPTPCVQNESFEWKYLTPADGAYTLQFKSADGTVLLTKTVVVDTVPPEAPTITTNNGADLILDSPGLSLNGTVKADTVTVSSSDLSGMMNFNPSLHQFTFSKTLTWGNTITFEFVAYDFVGNRSDPTSITVSYLPDIVMSLFSNEAGLGAVEKIGNNGLTTLNSVTMTPFSSAPITSPEGNLILTTGMVPLNYD